MPGYQEQIPEITQEIHYYLSGLDFDWVLWGIRIVFVIAVIFILCSYRWYSKKDEA